MTSYTANELMVCQAARQLRDGEVVFVGIGLPNLACNLARRLHAPVSSSFTNRALSGLRPNVFRSPSVTLRS